MATRTITVTACDLCNSADDVRTHTVRVSRWVRIIDACATCWTPVAATLDQVRRAGRKPTTA